ncbi:ShlB/FhaC/HecB family hemolysin secretion/activation protein [uncultured Cohaesibacter sp.]|uniref:ShlB/FhaC/HecB family hemolysin secretion/activation protein n=1 Tax=uncultured Cohaesibacter sp. TaxID=1002546 RepID=UPI002AAB8F9F|nr:ShlB/FhaC/HecB family hemolysin secretion/activation protein [uncultured Cohaesibacter sp.]
MTISNRKALCLSLLSSSVLCAVTLALSGPAQAQTASQITKHTYAPTMIKPVGHGVTLPSGGGLVAPAGADTLFVTPSGLDVSGGVPAMFSETAKIEASIKNRRITAADLFKAASALEKAYAKAGYLLVRVSLPPQTIKDGNRLKLVVTKGFIEAIDTSALSERVEPLVGRFLANLVGRNDVTRSDIERRLLLAGDTPGLHLKSVLKAGQTPGSTVIVVDGRHDAVTASVSLDNALSDEMGRWSVGLNAQFNSLLGFGEVVYGQISGYPSLDDEAVFDSDPRNRQLAAGFSVPLGTGGAWLGMEAVDSRTHPTSSVGFTVPDHFQRFTTRLGYHWIRSRNANLSSTISFDVASELQQTDVGGSRNDFTEDELRIVRFTQAGDIFPDWGGHLSASATLSVGLDALGARHGTTSLPLSRNGASPDFAKLDLNARFSHAFGTHFGAFSLAAKAQTSFGEPLVSSEQMGIAGMEWLSAFTNGDLAGDSALAVRAEWSMPEKLPTMFDWQSDIGGAVSPYLFAAAGVMSLEQPTAQEHDVTRAMSVGAGLRIGLSQKDSARTSALTLEYAYGDADHAGGQSRFNIALQASF